MEEEDHSTPSSHTLAAAMGSSSSFPLLFTLSRYPSLFHFTLNKYASFIGISWSTWRGQ